MQHSGTRRGDVITRSARQLRSFTILARATGGRDCQRGSAVKASGGEEGIDGGLKRATKLGSGLLGLRRHRQSRGRCRAHARAILSVQVVVQVQVSVGGRVGRGWRGRGSVVVVQTVRSGERSRLAGDGREGCRAKAPRRIYTSNTRGCCDTTTKGNLQASRSLVQQSLCQMEARYSVLKGTHLKFTAGYSWGQRERCCIACLSGCFSACFLKEAVVRRKTKLERLALRNRPELPLLPR